MMRMHSILTYLDLGETQRISCGIYHLRQVVTVSCLLLFYQVYHGTHCSSWDQLRDETEPVSVWFELAWCLPARPYWSRWCSQRHSLCASCKIFQNEDILEGNSRVMSLLVSPEDSAVSHWHKPQTEDVTTVHCYPRTAVSYRFLTRPGCFSSFRLHLYTNLKK